MARTHYQETLGMDAVHEQDGRVYLKSWDEDDHHSVVLEEGGVGLVKIGYKVTDGTLETVEDRVCAFGASYQRMAKGDNAGVGDGHGWDWPAVQRVVIRLTCRHRETPRRDRARAAVRASDGRNPALRRTRLRADRRYRPVHRRRAGNGKPHRSP
ncbi:VOC family protein [Crossiella cryophila]|uniref:Uncharacterized protein n=1 Tax=Crossiella cryophila TaxID=43355 RepID=A0A7W7FWA0_9PSEU|nr:hypothetical protein [Crossiella cryophila]MBB4680047.1 hypothetical protein [Crossiella cryophila]